MSEWKISIPVQVYDEKGRWVPAPGDGTPHAVGHRVEAFVRAETAQDALDKVSRWLLVQLDPAPISR